MSFVPYLQYSAKKSAQQIVTFGGIRYGRGGSDGDFSETLNLSSQEFPALSQRKGRLLYKAYENATALFARGKLLVVDGTNVIYDGKTVGQVTAGEKMITSVNSKIIIFPDKKYYDVDTETFGDMAVSMEIPAGSISWFTDYVIINGQGDLTKIFAAGQAVEFSGSSTSNNKTAVIKEVTSNSLKFLQNTFTAQSESNTVKVERKVPDLTCICESGNRLWGAEGQTIWASALGDPLTFYNYEGLSTDSFAVAVGTDGEFTGCVSYSSNVLFFKENALHKVLGSMPSEYRVYDYKVPGVQKGSQKSMVVINEVLYYKGTSGVYAYTGATPALVTENFGTRRFVNAKAGTDGMRYYISMQEETDGEEETPWDLFVLDQQSGIWLREDSTHVADFANLGTQLYALNAKDGDVYLLDQDTDERIKWAAEFYPFEDTSYSKRGYTKIWLKMELERGAWVKAEISEDGRPWRKVGTWSNKFVETVTAPIFPGRCSTFRLRLSGEGRCVIKSMVREYIMKSDS